MRIIPSLTLCFLRCGDEILMLHRRYPPNQGLWNGVGGHIEPGETPRQAVIREVREETGYQLDDVRFAGLLTWEGFEIPTGGLLIFTAEVSHQEFISNHEGDLAWVPVDWACSSPEVVDNIHVFLPEVLNGEAPRHYHFIYQGGVRIEDRIAPLPEDFDLERPFIPENELFEEKRGPYVLSTDKERLQFDVIEGYLSGKSYWAVGRPPEVIRRSIQYSVCFGIYHQGKQVAFARLVTDQATFAWLADVFVCPAHRGEGLGKWLVETICRYVDQQGIKRTILATRDAHQLYEKYGGFRTMDSAKYYMKRENPAVK